MNIGVKLKKIREQKRYSQQEIADILNISQKTYSNIESGKSDIKIKHLLILEQFFKINIITFLKSDDYPPHSDLHHLSNQMPVDIYKEIVKTNAILTNRINELTDLINQLLQKMK